jgi:alkanesulfonate monooxygenase SsuD/methylene tetrahydromethanopterin reductase-like flavin-dependent oxidoreductase (luciferase family)
VNRLDFYFFHLMPYPHIPPGDEIESSWITLSNSHYDPEVGHRLYNDYLDQIVAAEAFGYDGVCVNEHHQNAYGTMPAPDLMAAFIAARTEKIPFGIIGNALPLHGTPLRVAEEIAMLDVVSGGRIISGFVRGTGMEYFSSGANPTHSREQFWEAHDLIIKAWTEPGPFAWQGKHWDLPFVNPWPRPLQKPHPPIWLPGTGSFETIEKAAALRYPFMMVFAPQWFTKAAYDAYRRAADKHGYEPSPKQLAAAIPTYVGETDEQAEREFRPHVEWLFRTGLKIPSYQWYPPGYMSKKSFANMLGAKAHHNMKEHWELTWEELIEERYIICGSKDTVIERLSEVVDDLGAGIVLAAGGHIGTMPHQQVLESSQRMAEEVFPHFREPGNRPSYAAAAPAPPRAA